MGFQWRDLIKHGNERVGSTEGTKSLDRLSDYFFSKIFLLHGVCYEQIATVALLVYTVSFVLFLIISKLHSLPSKSKSIS
jgi:hypothetical protein